MTNEESSQYLWAIGCNVAFRRGDDGFTLDRDYTPPNDWLEHLRGAGLLAPEIATEYDDLADGDPLVLVPVGAHVEVLAADAEVTRSPLPLAPIAAGIAIGVAGNAVYDGIKAGYKALVNSSGPSGNYQPHPHPNPRPPVGGGPMAI